MATLIRVGVDTAGGVILGGGNSTVYVDGSLVGVTGDSVAGHGPPPHASPVMTGGSSTVFVMGIPATRGGIDVASCGHVSSSGSSVNVGG